MTPAKATLTVGCIALMVVCSSAGIISLDTAAGTPTAYAAHEPIEISSDSGFNASNGVVSGSGTSGNPYIIQGWEIKDAKAESYGIFITRTTAHFTITQVHISNTSKGIYFFNVTHGKVDHSLIDNQSMGILLYASDSIAILDNNIRDCWKGVVLTTSTNVRMDGNHYARNTLNVDKPPVDWEETWIGRAVCIAILIPLTVVLIGAIYMRYSKKGKDSGPPGP